MSKVAPVMAVLVMMWTARAATSARGDHAADRERGAELRPARFEVIAEQ
jgi:hypothetical protein